MVPLRWSLKQLGLATSATMWTWLVGASFEYTMATQRKTIKLRIRLEFTLTSVCVCVFVSATSDRFSPVWRFRPYKPYIFWKAHHLATAKTYKKTNTQTQRQIQNAWKTQCVLYFWIALTWHLVMTNKIKVLHTLNVCYIFFKAGVSTISNMAFPP